MSCARHLTSMRIRAGISQNIMAAALNCRQPRISEIESTPNEHISMTIILKYCEVTGLPFKAELENGRTVSVSRPPPQKGEKRKSPGIHPFRSHGITILADGDARSFLLKQTPGSLSGTAVCLSLPQSEAKKKMTHCISS